MEGGNNIKKSSETMLIPEEEIISLREENAILKEAHAELINQIEGLSKNAFYDPLTGLKSRAFFEEEMKYILGNVFQSKRLPDRREGVGADNEDAGLIMFDLDKFKNVNDTLGHLAGDEVLKAVAEVVKNSVRDLDIAARWGGEELVVVLVGANTEETIAKAEEIRVKVSALQFADYPDLRVTISAGVALASNFKDKNTLFSAADKALYQSKNTGRNRVTAYAI